MFLKCGMKVPVHKVVKYLFSLNLGADLVTLGSTKVYFC